nr:hypothetical protein [uncultured Kingella sp.]
MNANVIHKRQTSFQAALALAYYRVFKSRQAKKKHPYIFRLPYRLND